MSRPPRTLTRRAFVRLGLLIGVPVVSACDPVRTHLGSTPSASPTISDTARTLTAAIATERGLLAQYDAVIAAAPALRPRLAPIAAEHRAHLDALEALDAAPSAQPSEAPSTGTPAATPVAAVAGLIRAERAAARALSAASLSQPADVAVLMGSIAASESSHLVVLGRLPAR
jgi:hypothetical protein